MDRSAGRRRWAAARAGLLAVLGAGLLAACGLGGEAPTATPVAPSPTVAPTATIPLPTPTSAAAPTAPRNGNPTGATGWQVAGLTGEVLYALGGTGALNAPVYAGGTGLWSTTDQGATWEDRGLAKGTRIAEIEVSVSNPKVIYAGTGAGCAGGQPSGQFRSTDGGATWQPLPQAPASIQIDGKNPDHLIAMTCRGVVRSADGGQTWTALTDRGAAALVNHNGTLVRVAPSDPAVIYATYVAEGGSTRIRTSTDSGTTWTDSGAEYPGLSDILVDAAHPQHAWAAIPGFV